MLYKIFFKIIIQQETRRKQIQQRPYFNNVRMHMYKIPILLMDIKKNLKKNNKMRRNPSRLKAPLIVKKWALFHFVFLTHLVLFRNFIHMNL
jgi:hypothetical protein